MRAGLLNGLLNGLLKNLIAFGLLRNLFRYFQVQVFFFRRGATAGLCTTSTLSNQKWV